MQRNKENNRMGKTRDLFIKTEDPKGTFHAKMGAIKDINCMWSCMDVRVGMWRKLSAEEVMLLNCGVGEDSWECLGLSGKKSTLNIHWKDWYWSWSSNTLVTWYEKLTHWEKKKKKTCWCPHWWHLSEFIIISSFIVQLHQTIS